MKKILLGTIAFISTVSYAQDSTKKGNLAITGSVDVYYRYNFHNAKDSGHTTTTRALPIPKIPLNWVWHL